MTLLDLLDGVIDTGVVIRGELLISIANIDLIVVDLKLSFQRLRRPMEIYERENRREEAIVNGTITTKLQ